MKKLLALAYVAIFAAMPQVALAATSDFRLQIQRQACSVDQIQNGPGQSTLISPESCERAETSLPIVIPLPTTIFPEGPERNAQAFTDNDQPVAIPTETTDAVESEHTIDSSFGQISSVGQVLINNPGYTSMGAIASIPAVIVADTFVLKGKLKNSLLRLKGRFWK